MDNDKAAVNVGIGVVLRFKHTSTRISTELTGAQWEVLLTRRKPGAVYAGYWEFPGGKAGAGEAMEACVRRELEEEVGVDVEVFGSLTEVEHTYPHGRVRLHPLLCRLRRTSPAPASREVAEHRWAPLDELPAYRFPEANESIVRELLAMIRRGAITPAQVDSFRG